MALSKINTNSIASTANLALSGANVAGKLVMSNPAGNAIDIIKGQLAWNRVQDNGIIYDSNEYGFQISQYLSSRAGANNSLGMEVYKPDGTGAGTSGSTTNVLSVNSPFIIDGPSAQMRQPNKAGFIVHDNRNAGAASTADANISQYFTTVRYNSGHFATSGNTGRFTAPVDGIYLFGWSLFSQVSQTTASRLGICVNGTSSYISIGDEVGRCNAGTVLIRMAKNDYATLGTQGGVYTAYWYTSDIHSTYYGFLVG